MKVKLQEGFSKSYTIEDMEAAKKVISYEKEDEETAKGWSEYAIREALNGTDDYVCEVLKAEAVTAKNCRIWDGYGEGTGSMDVFIMATAETTRGFVKIGAYLSDIWQTGAIDYREHMYIKKAWF